MTVFEVIGGVTAGWALLVAFLGITREGFPATDGSQRIALSISVVLVAASIASAIIGAANEKHDEGGDKAALVR